MKINPEIQTEIPRRIARRSAGLRSATRLLSAGGLALAIAVAPAAYAGDAGEVAKEAGLGAGSALASLIYAPVKLVYAAGGLVIGGLAYAFSGGDSEVARVVFTPSLRGDYVVTTAHLKGEQRLEFLGRDGGYGHESASVASAPESEYDSGGW